MTNVEYRQRLVELRRDPSGRYRCRLGAAFTPTLFVFPWFSVAEATLTAILAEHGITEGHAGDVPDEVWSEAAGGFGVSALRWSRERQEVDR